VHDALVSASRAKENECGGTQTLGDLLYADPERVRVQEAEWVALIHAIAAGDQAALRVLYERSRCLVFTLALRISGKRQTAEEVTLDVFHDVWRRASTYDVETGSVLGWIMNQARSHAIDRARFDQRNKRVDTGAATADAAEDADDQARSLQIALTALTEEERQAIETAFFSGLTHAEVAMQLQQPLGTVKTRIRSAFMKLRRVLLPESGR
jgi:RNA polymerase sigma-70 factor (ECF subfamily)